MLEADILHLICAGFSHIQVPLHRDRGSPLTPSWETFPNSKHSRGLLWAQHCPFPPTADGNRTTPQLHCSQECALPAHVLLRLTFHASHSLVNISMANSQESESFIASILVPTLYLKQDKECKTKTTHYCSPLSFL